MADDDELDIDEIRERANADKDPRRDIWWVDRMADDVDRLCDEVERLREVESAALRALSLLEYRIKKKPKPAGCSDREITEKLRDALEQNDEQ